MMPAKRTIRNPLAVTDPQLVFQMAALRDRVYDLLLDKLAAASLNKPSFRGEQFAFPMADIKANAQILRVLTKEAWDGEDLTIFAACWRDASHSELFAEEFEPERHRIQHAVEAARKDLTEKSRSFC